MKQWKLIKKNNIHFQYKKDKSESPLFFQATPVQAQPRCGNEKPDLATGGPPGQAGGGGAYWARKGDLKDCERDEASNGDSDDTNPYYNVECGDEDEINHNLNR